MFIIVIDRDQNNEDAEHNKVVVNVDQIISVKNENGFANLILTNEWIRCSASFDEIVRELGVVENPRITRTKVVRRRR